MGNEKTDFPEIRRFIGRMFLASKTIGETVTRLEEDIPRLSNTVNLEKYEIDVVLTHLEAIKEYNSQVRAMAGNMMENAEFLEDAKHNMRDLATVAQLPLLMAESSPEFFVDLIGAINPPVLDDGIAGLSEEALEKLEAAIAKRKKSDV